LNWRVKLKRKIKLTKESETKNLKKREWGLSLKKEPRFGFKDEIVKKIKIWSKS
jgi:hypothetical protein